MTVANGRVLMGDTISPPALSPVTFSPTKTSMKSSTLNDASLDELDRIMDTLSTLSRDTSSARDVDDKRSAVPSTPSSGQTGQRSYTTAESGTGSDSTTPYSATSPARGFPVSPLEYLPPPITSPPKTPVTQSPRHFSTHNPKVMTISGIPSYQSYNHMRAQNDGCNPATIPRLPNYPYENTSILHGSHMMRPSNITTAQNPSYYTTHIPDSPYVNKNTPLGNEGQYFFGPLPVSPQQERYPPTGPKPNSMLPHSSSDDSKNERMPSQHRNNRDDVESSRLTSKPPKDNTRKQHHSSRAHKNDSLTLPAYNEKRSYLKNLEQGTLPRPRIESARQYESSQNLTPQLSRKLSKPKPSYSEEVGESLNRLSLRKRQDKDANRPSNRLQNISKTPSRHSTTSFNSYEPGRGYASVSTAPASTHGLVQHEILPHGRKKSVILSPITPESQSTRKTDDEEENCCIRCGRFLHSHMLELFILVAFCAGFPIGIVLQATGYHATPTFGKYFTFWGSTMLPMVLSTITPMLILSSMLTGMSNLTTNVLKRLTILSSLYYFASSVVAVSIAVAFSMIIKPGNFAVNVSPNNTSSLNQNLSDNTLRFTWPNTKILLEKGVLKDDGQSLFSMNEENLFYDTSAVENITVSDEILTLISLFFPGCGYPNKQDTGICNVFVLVFFAGIIGIGASAMRTEGGPIRHVVSQIGTVMSNMADIILWYIPFGVLFYVSEIVATRIDWENIGSERIYSFGGNVTTNPNDVTSLNTATVWFLITVFLSLGIYCLILMPLTVSLMTLSNPFSLIGFRSVAPLLTAIVTGFSDLCIPLTVRCLLKRKGTSRCCTPQEQVDRRIARVSAVTGGIFHRGGSAIVIVCSTMFLLQVNKEPHTAMGTVLLCISSMITSVTSTGGRWFHGTTPFMRAIVIGISTAGYGSPSAVPQTVLGLWFISRFAAFADTIIDLVGAQLLHKVCKSGIRDTADIKENTEKDGRTDCRNIEHTVTERAVTVHKNPPTRSTGGETSDYEDVPLLFSSKNGRGNESNSMNSRNDDSVFLPNKPQYVHTNQHNHTELHIHEATSSNHRMPPPVVQNHNSRSHDYETVHLQPNPPGVLNQALNNKDEVSFVTF